MFGGGKKPHQKKKGGKMFIFKIIRWFLTVFTVLLWGRVLFFTIFDLSENEFNVLKKLSDNSIIILAIVFIFLIAVILFMWFFPFKKTKDNPEIDEIKQGTIITPKGRKEFHLRVMEGDKCCGDLDLICKKCGHQGLLSMSEKKEPSFWIGVSCPECKHKESCSFFELNEKWKKV